MKIFTDEDYWKYYDFIVSNHLVIAENSESYELEKGQERVYQEHDKIFKKILENKKEAASFINKALKLECSINSIELERYNSSFITEGLKSQESDIIYKLKDRDIYFLIEHQTKIDNTMPIRILKYIYNIINSEIDINKMNHKEYKIPKVIPIVLYSGRKKWNAKKSIQERQDKLEGYHEIEFDKYNVVDVNDYSEEELLEEKTLLSKAMLIEKKKDTDELVKYLDKIVEEMNKSKYEKEQKELLSTIINLVLRRKIGQDETNNLIERLKEQGGENMLAVLEMIDEENKRIYRNGKRNGKKEGRMEGKKEQTKEIARKMLDKGTDIEFIMAVTDLSREEIEKLK